MIKKYLNLSIFKSFNSSRGFTILESIVAIFILSMSVSGVFSSVQQSLYQAAIAKDEVKAFYLAQEAIEIIRNKRDNNQLIKISTGAGGWLDGITSSCPFGRTCTVDAAVGFPIVNCGVNWGSCTQNLKQDTTNTLRYGYNSSWFGTAFKREIQIELVRNDEYGNPVEIAITVEVSWNGGKFKVKTHLFNWI
jgi:prepilin-type N-terminal cleavage/methylation domain-containing protein